MEGEGVRKISGKGILRDACTKFFNGTTGPRTERRDQLSSAVYRQYRGPLIGFEREEKDTMRIGERSI